MPNERILSFKSKEYWSRWLETNHDSSQEAWLLIHKKHLDAEALKYEDALEEAIRWGWIDGKLRSIDDKTHIIRFTPRRSDSVWSEHNRTRAERIMKAGEMTEHGKKTVQEGKRSGQWAAAYSLREPPRVPDDLKDALAGNKRARRNFDSMSNSHKHAYVFWVKSAKREETRKKRIREVVKMASAGKKL